MKGLLDTHVFIWWDSDPSKLSAPALAFLQDPANTVFLSVVSIWEILIKLQLGKLTLGAPLASIVAQQRANGIQILPVPSTMCWVWSACPRRTTMCSRSSKITKTTFGSARRAVWSV